MNENKTDIERKDITPAGQEPAAVPPENIKGSLYRWTRESAGWYEKASEYTGYHDRLTEIISPFIDKSFTCCEIACGTGTLARHLAPLAASYTANDIDPHATANLMHMLISDNIDNVDVITGDWHRVLEGKHFNAAVISYFGAVEQDWEPLSDLVSDLIVVIAPRSREGKFRSVDKANDKNDTGAPGTRDITRPDRIVRGKARSFETGPSICRFLDEKGISYTCEDRDLEFGQPFDNLSQARDYVRYYYHLDEKDIDIFMEKKLVRRDDVAWFMPKTKEISIIMIDMKSALK